MGALAYRDDKLVGIEIDQEFIAGTTRDWVKRGLRVELTTEDDAVDTWKAYWRKGDAC